MRINHARHALREQKPISFKIPRNNQTRAGTPQEYYDEGILLYDPFRAIYDKSLSSNKTPDEVGRAVDQVFSLEPPLPLEIAEKITAYAHEELDLDKMTAAPAKFSIDARRLDVHLLVPMDPKEINIVQETYNENLRVSGKSMTCIVYPWLASRPANRQELWSLFQRVCQKRYSNQITDTVFLFVGWPGWQEGAEVGLMQWNAENPPPTRRVPIEKAADVWDAAYNTGSPYYQSDTCTDYSDPAFELMLDPRGRFFFDPPPFVSLLTNIYIAPIFMLTKHMTKDEISSIKIEINGPEYHEDSFVEWHSNTDGTVEDMWRLLWQCYICRGYCGTPTAIFIDRQSASDHRVIVTEIM